MTARKYLAQQVEALEAEILKMGKLVEANLQLAIMALTDIDFTMADQVFMHDIEINALRHAIEKKTATLIATQQPMAVDLRKLISILVMSIDLEQMGDQAKNIGKAIPFLIGEVQLPALDKLQAMAELGARMLRESLVAYQEDDFDLAKQVAETDEEMDRLFASIYAQIITHPHRGNNIDDTQISYEILRAAQALERFGDLVTNLAERVIYNVTSEMTEINLDYVADGPGGQQEAFIAPN